MGRRLRGKMEAPVEPEPLPEEEDDEGALAEGEYIVGEYLAISLRVSAHSNSDTPCTEKIKDYTLREVKNDKAQAYYDPSLGKTLWIVQYLVKVRRSRLLWLCTSCSSPTHSGKATRTRPKTHGSPKNPSTHGPMSSTQVSASLLFRKTKLECSRFLLRMPRDLSAESEKKPSEASAGRSQARCRNEKPGQARQGS